MIYQNCKCTVISDVSQVSEFQFIGISTFWYFQSITFLVYENYLSSTYYNFLHIVFSYVLEFQAPMQA